MIRKTILRTFNAGGVLYPYTEFLGDGPPSMDLGESGDIYVDLTPGSLALYGRCSKEWKIWAGPQNRKAEDWVVHPSHTDRCLWCSDNSFGWFTMRFARGRPSVHSTASEALTAAKDAQIEKNVERKRKAKEKPELLGPAATKMKLTSTQSRPINTGISSANEPNSLLRPGLNADSSKSTSPTHPVLLQATDPDPNPTRSSSVGSLSSLPSSFGHPTQSFDISAFLCESSTSPQWPIQRPHGGIYPFEADSNRVNAVQNFRSPVEGGRRSSDTLPDKYSQVIGSRSPATFLEKPQTVIEDPQIGPHIMGFNHSTSSSSIDSGDVALPGGETAQRSNQLMQPDGTLPLTPNAEQRAHADLPVKAHTCVDIAQPPYLTTGDAAPLILSLQSRGDVILSECDHRIQYREQMELHVVAERAAQRIREADKEIERLKGENVILRSQLHDSVRVGATYSALPSLGITDGYPSEDAVSIVSSPRPPTNSSPGDHPELEAACAASPPQIPDVTSPTGRGEMILEEASVHYDIVYSVDGYPPQVELPAQRRGDVFHGLNNSEPYSKNPKLSMTVGEANLDILMSDPDFTAAKVGSELPSPHLCNVTEHSLTIGGPTVVSGPLSQPDSYPETPEIVSIPGVPELAGGALEPLVAISPSAVAEAGDNSLSISPTSAAILEEDGDALSRNEGDTLNQTEFGIETLDQDLPVNCYSSSPDPGLGLNETQISILFADEGDFMVCRICLGTNEEIFRVYKTGVSPQHVEATMQRHCDKRHRDEIQMLISLTEDELCDVRDRLRCFSEGKG